MAEVEGHELCPLCVEPLDATDRAIRYCACGYRMCLWCWHQIMETAGKDNQEGRCPNCRKPYEKDKVSMCDVDQEEIAEEKRKKKTEKEKRRGSVVPNGKPRKHLQDVRILQRNLVYAVGLSLGICNDETLKRMEYFGQFGKIKKISVNRSSPYSTGQSRNGPTGAAYVTYHLDPDAANCIETIDGAVWDGRYVRACYGTTKYCAAFLKGVTCNNADCLYMHDIAVSDDTFTKEDMLSGFACGKPPFYHLIYFDRSKGPVPGSLAIKPPKGPASSSSGSMSSRGQDLSPGGTSRGTNALSARSSGEGQDWPELNGRPSTLDTMLREGPLRSRTPRDGTPREGARRDGTPRDRFSRSGTPRDGTPRDGTPRDGTPRDGTPRDGTPRDGTPRCSEEGSRLVIPRRSSDGSWTHRSAGTPRSPMQGQSSSQNRTEAAPKKTLAVLSSPLKVKMVTRPPPHTKAPLTPTSRSSGDGGKPLERPSSRCSDSGRDSTFQGKDSKDGPADSTGGHSSGSNSGIYSRSPLRSRPSFEAAVPHNLQDQALPTRKSSTPRFLDSRDGGGKGGRRSPCPPELSMGLRPSGSRVRPNGQEDGRKSRGGSREGTPRSDSLSGTPRSDSLPLTPGHEENSAGVPSDEAWKLSGEEGISGGAGRGLLPGSVKSGSSFSKGVSRRGPPPGFENSFARRNSIQSGATGQTEKDEEVPAAQADTQQTLQASQGVPALGQVSGTQQMGDAPSLLNASQVLKQNEVDMNVQENRPRQDFASGASVPAVGMPADVPGSLPTGGVADLSATQMQSLLLGLTSQSASPSLLQLGAQQNQPGGIPVHGMQLGLDSHIGEPDAGNLAGRQTTDGLCQPLQPNGLFQHQQQQQQQQQPPQQQQQVQSPLAATTNPLLDLLRQLQLGPTARQKVPADNGFHQHTQATMLSPLNDPAVLAVKKTSEKAAVASGGSGLQSSLIGGGSNLQGQNFGNGALLMYGVMQQQQQQQQQQLHLHQQQQQQLQLQLQQQLQQQQQQQQTILHERQLGLGVRGLQQNPSDFFSGQFPQTPFAMGDNAALLNSNGLLGLGGSSQVERQLGWGQMNSQSAQVPQEFLGSYMAGNSGLMAHNAAQETMMLGMGPSSDPLQLGLVPGMGIPPQLPLQMMEQNNTKFFASQGAPRGGTYGPL